MSKQWKVEGYRRIKVSMTVEAETRREAISKALNGEYTEPDTEPDGDINTAFWTAARLPRTPGAQDGR